MIRCPNILGKYGILTTFTDGPEEALTSDNLYCYDGRQKALMLRAPVA